MENGECGIYYVVQSGDTLSRISERFTGSILYCDLIARDNRILNPDYLLTGRVIFIKYMGKMERRKIQRRILPDGRRIGLSDRRK